MSEEDFRGLADELARFRGSLRSIHLAGGEPFIRFDFLVEAVRIVTERNLPLAYVETNAYWATSDRVARSKLETLREAGLRAILISVSPFHLEHIPFERTERAVRIAREVLGPWNVLLFTDGFYEHFRNRGFSGTLRFDEYRRSVPETWLAKQIQFDYQFVPNGRGAFKLASLFAAHPAETFFRENCRGSLGYPGHVHIDLYGNYVGGLCAGISVGNGFDLRRLYEEGTPLEDRPVLRMLVEEDLGALFRWAVDEFGFEPSREGYIAKCHLCADIRRHVFQKGYRGADLAPPEFYQFLLVDPLGPKEHQELQEPVERSEQHGGRSSDTAQKT